MLSIANISSSAQASSYYELDDYYAKDSDEHKGLSQWFGKGAEKLGLEGQVNTKDFKEILDGKLPNGIELGRKEKDELVHAPGIDMTFSAPKSVSIMSEVGGDTRIHDAHAKAVTKALEWVQDNAVATRSMSEGKLEVEEVNNMIVAMFRHDTSRNMDPQLHTHCVVANAVMREDKEWRSAFFGKIFEDKIFIGQVYRSELAKGMSELGYTVIPTHKDGRFEIKEVPSNVLEEFSSRSKEIREALKEYDIVNGKTAANAAIRTRENKREMDREFLHNKWNEVSRNLGFDAKEVVKEISDVSRKVEGTIISTPLENSFKDYAVQKWEAFLRIMGRPIDDNKFDHVDNYKWDSKDKSPINIKSVKYALAHLAERQSVFEKKEIYEHALSFGLGRIGLADIDKAIDKLTKEEIILSNQYGNKNLITTREALEREKATLQYMEKGRGAVKAIYSKTRIDKLLESTNLNISQTGAAKHVLTTEDRVTAIQGYAGTGKTHTLGIVRTLAEAQGYRLIGMAPSASAADTLQKDAGIESSTIHQFLFKYDGVINGRGTEQGRVTMREELKKTILVLDESSLASTKQMHGLLKLATVLDTRVLLVGDTKQLGAVEAGKPFAQLQEHKMSVVVMDDIFRQKKQELKEAVLHSLEGNVYKALGKLKDNVIENKEVAKTAADLWLKHKERDNTLVLAPSNETRLEINRLIRDQLKKESIINSYTETSLDKLDSKNMTQAQNSFAINYEKGNVVLFNRPYSKLGVSKGDYLKVAGVDSEKQLVKLIDKQGREINWRPGDIGGNAEGAIEVFVERKIEIAEGDKVIWKHNSKENGIINSHTAIVQEIGPKIIKFKTQSGKEVELWRNEDVIKHIDHAYAVTVYSAQGKTSDNVIAVAESRQKNLTIQPTFYVEISRARYEAILVVDDKQAVARQLSEATGQRISAMESQGLVYEGESPFMKVDNQLLELDKQYQKEIQENTIKESNEVTVHNPVDIKIEESRYEFAENKEGLEHQKETGLFNQIKERLENRGGKDIDPSSITIELSSVETKAATDFTEVLDNKLIDTNQKSEVRERIESILQSKVQEVNDSNNLARITTEKDIDII